MTPNNPEHARSWTGTARALYLAALACLALAASACREELHLEVEEDSFRKFAECALIEDFPGRRMKLQDAWLQNIVAKTPPAPAANPPKSSKDAPPPAPSTPDELIVTGVIRAATGKGQSREDLVVLQVRKVLDEYKVVNWATNLDGKESRNLQALGVELPSKPYRGRCSWS